MSLGFVQNSPSFVLRLEFDYGGFGQVLSGYCFSNYSIETDSYEGSKFGMDYIIAVLDIADCNTLDELKGQPIRVDCSINKVYGIGHFLKDRWFYPEDLVSEVCD